MTALLLFGILCLALAVYFVAEAATAPAREQESSMKRAARYGIGRARGQEEPRVAFRQRVVLPAISRLAALALKLSPKTNSELINSRLIASGLASRFTVTQYLALKTGFAITGTFMMLGFGVATSPLAGFLLAPVACVCGFMFPDAYTTMKVRSRREAVRAQLPDALDLLAV